MNLHSNVRLLEQSIGTYASPVKYYLFIHLFMQLHGKITQASEREGRCSAGRTVMINCGKKMCVEKVYYSKK